jgi:hypothetical protein
MDLTFSPLPLAIGGRGDSFTFMVEDFDLDGGAHHHQHPQMSPTLSTNPSTPALHHNNGSMLNSAGSLKMPVSNGRRNSFDAMLNGPGGRHRSLSFEFFNMDASSSSSVVGALMNSNPHQTHHQPYHQPSTSGYAPMMSPEDALLMAATPKGMSSLKRKHLPFSSFNGSNNAATMMNLNQHYNPNGTHGLGMGQRHSNQFYGDLLAQHQQPLPKKQKKSKTRGPKAQKYNSDGTKIERKKKKTKKTRGPRKSKKNSKDEPVEFFDPSVPRIGIYTLEQRAEKIQKWIAKARRRIWDKKIKYGCRKRLADARPRYKGRFVKSLPEEKLSISKLDGMIDPELIKAQEATRRWKAEQAAKKAAEAEDAKVKKAKSGKVVIPIGFAAPVAPAATMASVAPVATVVPVAAPAAPDAVAVSMANPQASTPPGTPPSATATTSPTNATSSTFSRLSEGESTPKSPVTVTGMKQVSKSSSSLLSQQEKITFVEQTTTAATGDV